MSDSKISNNIGPREYYYKTEVVQWRWPVDVRRRWWARGTTTTVGSGYVTASRPGSLPDSGPISLHRFSGGWTTWPAVPLVRSVSAMVRSDGIPGTGRLPLARSSHPVTGPTWLERVSGGRTTWPTVLAGSGSPPTGSGSPLAGSGVAPGCGSPERGSSRGRRP